MRTHECADLDIDGLRILRRPALPGLRHIPIGISWKKLVCDLLISGRMLRSRRRCSPRSWCAHRVGCGQSGVASLEKRVDQLDGKVERLDQNVKTLDRRVAVVEVNTEHINENVGRLEINMRDMHRSIDKEFDSIDKRFDSVDEKFDSLIGKFDEIHRELRGLMRFMIAAVRPCGASWRKSFRVRA